VTAVRPHDQPVGSGPIRSEAGPLVPALMFIALVVAAVASLGTPLVTSVATTFHVSLDSAQWTLTIALLSGAVATPVLGRLGAGPHRRATILATLAIVVVGSALTVLPLPFAWLLVGRAAQGVGLGLTALMMGVARDHLPEERSAAVIALISVVSIIGAGVGYPLAALLAEFGGPRAAYGLGLLVTAIAFVTAWRSVPAVPEGRSAHVNVTGALVLAGGLLLVLFLAGDRGLWSRHLAVAVVLAVVAVLLLCVWTVSELRSKTPLVDVRAVRHPAVAGANIAMFVGGSGMYLLLTLITRYAQTPHSAGYGFGLTTFVAGLVLIPFSVLGFIAGKLTPRVRTRIDGPLLLAGSAAIVGGGFVLFATARSNLTELLAAMGVLGFGVGSFSAAMPGVILAVTPKSETSSAMSFNYVVRSVGYSLGSAVGGLILAEGTGPGHLFPDDSAYTTAALVGIGAMAITTLTCLALARRRPSEANPYVRCTHPHTGGSMPKGYWVSVYRTISDPEKLAAYNKLAAPAVKAGGGRTFARGGRVAAYDAGTAERTVLIEFDSFEQAVAARESAAYQEALAVLADGVERDFRIIEGLE
jgi:MFS family permease